jgi:hypothetical protein
MRRLSLAFALSLLATCAFAAGPGTIDNTISPLGPTGYPNGGVVGFDSEYPAGAIPVANSAVGTTAAVVATLPASTTGKTTYICGFYVSAVATGALAGNITVTGLLNGQQNFTTLTQAVATGINPTPFGYSPCYPASAPNTAIVVTSPAAGAGGVNSATAVGYQL